MERSNAHVGMVVTFGRSRGEQTRGKIVKCNPRKAKVEQLEERGVRKVRPAGTIWTVPYSLMTPSENIGIGAPIPKPPRSNPNPFTTEGQRKADMASFKVGDAVEFNSKGSVVQGHVMRVNRKTVSVKPNGESSLRYWRVSPGLLRYASR